MSSSHGSHADQQTKNGAIIHVMEEYVRRKKVNALLALRGRVTVEYDWQAEEKRELKVAGEREEYHGITGRWSVLTHFTR